MLVGSPQDALSIQEAGCRQLTVHGAAVLLRRAMRYARCSLGRRACDNLAWLARKRRQVRASGEIGRRARFRSVCPKGHGGSSPPSRTEGGCSQNPRVLFSQLPKKVRPLVIQRPFFCFRRLLATISSGPTSCCALNRSSSSRHAVGAPFSGTPKLRRSTPPLGGATNRRRMPEENKGQIGGCESVYVRMVRLRLSRRSPSLYSLTCWVSLVTYFPSVRWPRRRRLRGVRWCSGLSTSRKSE